MVSLRVLCFRAIYRQQQALFDYARRQSHYNGKGNRYAPNYSAAAASIGPGGAYQTAYISPGNPVSCIILQTEIIHLLSSLLIP